jgi:hypothetical protein
MHYYVEYMILNEEMKNTSFPAPLVQKQRTEEASLKLVKELIKNHPFRLKDGNLYDDGSVYEQKLFVTDSDKWREFVRGVRKIIPKNAWDEFDQMLDNI